VAVLTLVAVPPYASAFIPVRVEALSEIDVVVAGTM
jgi:hypothetical protein